MHARVHPLWSKARKAALVCAALLLHPLQFASAEAEDVLLPGDVAVSSFAGVKLQTEALPPNVDPVTKTVIDPDGITLTIFNAANVPLSGAGTQLNLPMRLNFTARQLGHVFPLAYDMLPPDERGTPGLYAGATSAFGLNIVGPDGDEDGMPDRISAGAPGASFMEGQFGPSADGGAGAIWKIDQATGQLSLYAEIKNSGPGLGGLAFDPASRTFYASDLDTGVIVHLGGAATGNGLGQFDHGVDARPLGGKTAVPDDGRLLDISSPQFNSADPATWGSTQIERRVDALAVHGGRLYYAAADGPEIWSVGLGPDGGFQEDARIEFAVPLLLPGTVTAITFDGEGRMLLAIRNAPQNTGDFVALTASGPSDVMRFTPESPDDPQTPFAWLPDAEFYGTGNAPEHRDASGGVALQYAYKPDGTLDLSSCYGTLLASADALGQSRVSHGLQIGPVNQFQSAPGLAAAADFLPLSPEQDNLLGRGHVGAVAALMACTGADGFPAVADGGNPGFPGLEAGGGGGGAPGFPGVEQGGGGGGFPDVEQGGGGKTRPGNLTLAKTATVPVCNPKGGCAFNIEVRNDGGEVKGPIVVNELIEAPDAVLTGEPNAPWQCSKAAPFVCTHPGPVPANGKLDMRVVFAPNLAADAKEIKNCAVQAVEAGKEAAAPVCATIPLDPNAPVQSGPIIVSKKGASKCTADGPCTFSISVQNTTDQVVAGPIVIDEKLDAPGAALLGEPNAPWQCSKAAPFTCTHPGPLPPKSAVDLTLSFAPKLPPGTKTLKNCAIVKGPLAPPAKKAEIFVPAKEPQMFSKAAFRSQSIGKRSSLLHFVDDPGGNIGGINNKCANWKWIGAGGGFSVQQSNNIPVSFVSLTRDGLGNVTGRARHPNGAGTMNGNVTGKFDGLHFDLTVAWDNGNVGHYVGDMDANGEAFGTTVGKDGAKATFRSIAAHRHFACQVTEGQCDAFAKSMNDIQEQIRGLNCFASNDKLGDVRGTCVKRPDLIDPFAKQMEIQLSDCKADRAAKDKAAADAALAAKANDTFCGDFAQEKFITFGEISKLDCAAKAAVPANLDQEAIKQECMKNTPLFTSDALQKLKEPMRKVVAECRAEVKAKGGDAGNAGGGAGGGQAQEPAPEQCATVAIDDANPPVEPAEDEPAPVAEKPVDGKPAKAANGLEVTKQIIPGACTADGCVFRITVKNTTNAEIAGPISFFEQLTGEIGKVPNPFKTEITSGPDAPWTCTLRDELDKFECKHPGPVAAGAALTATMNMKLVDAAAAETLTNCAVLDENAASCATAPLKKPAKDQVPAKAANGLEISKRPLGAGLKCEAGRACLFTISIKNTTAADIKGPIVITDVPRAADGGNLALPKGGAELGAISADFAGGFKILPLAPWVCAPGQQTTCTHPGPVPVGGTISISASVTPGRDATAQSMENCAVLKNGDATAARSCITVPLKPAPQGADLKLTKRADPCVRNDAKGRFECNFLITVTNVGTAPFKGPVKIADQTPLADGLKVGFTAGIPWSCPSEGDPLNGSRICENRDASIDAGASITLPITVTVPTDMKNACVVLNVASLKEPPAASGNADDGFGSSRLGTATAIVPNPDCAPPVNLAITKTAAPDCARNAAGNHICTFKLSVSNPSANPFKGVLEVSDSINMPGAKFLSFSQPSPGPWSCTKKEMAPELEGQGAMGVSCKTNAEVVMEPFGAPLEIDLAFEVSQPSPRPENCKAINFAGISKPDSMTSLNFDPKDDLSLAFARIPMVVGPNGEVPCDPPSLQLTKVANPQICAKAGDGFDCSYDIDVTSMGPDPFHGPLKITETLPAGAQLVKVSAPWGCTGTGNVKECTHPFISIPVGSNVRMSVTAHIPESLVRPGACTVSNRAQLSFDAGPLAGQSFDALASASIDSPLCSTPLETAGEPQLAITKRATSAQCDDAKTPCTFEVAITNQGNGEAKGPITLYDVQSFNGQPTTQANLVIEPEAPWYCLSSAAPGMTCTHPGPLAPGASLLMSVGVQPQPGSAGTATEIKNCATLEGVRPGRATACATVPIAKVEPPPFKADACLAGAFGGGPTCKDQGTGTGGFNTSKPIDDAQPVLTPPAQACKFGMVLASSGLCACPENTKWNGKECAGQGTGGSNMSAPIPDTAEPPPQKTTPAPVKPRVCPAGRPVGKYPDCCPKGYEFRNGKCRLPRQQQQPQQQKKVCPADRPNGQYPNCCPDGYEFRNGKCRPPRQQQPEQQKFCEGDRPNGVYPNCCPDGYSFARGKCRRDRQQQPEQNNDQGPVRKTCPDGSVVIGKYTQCPDDKPVMRSCPDGYRVLSKPNKYGAYCEIIPVPGPAAPEKPKCPSGTRMSDDGQCYPIVR